ncbi:hypothetical protein PR048_002545 [Dryococelus australis]|uniref:Uncharacterized protein n=1 Tax=Dryococelus australis TaxID=614101 RepID=A0ABQ9IKI7_9NEOP|nr:hypothetical protein PR048_002545 [Dryococelus australis]
MLSSMGMCVPYKETDKFEGSVTACTEDTVNSGYVQFVYFNADHNVNTLDGHGTFHAMGGIECVTPFSSVNVDIPVPRNKKVTAA